MRPVRPTRTEKAAGGRQASRGFLAVNGRSFRFLGFSAAVRGPSSLFGLFLHEEARNREQGLFVLDLTETWTQLQELVVLSNDKVPGFCEFAASVVAFWVWRKVCL